MEQLKRFKEYILYDPISLLKYTLILGGLYVSFANLFNCIIKGYPLSMYLLNFGVVFIGVVLLAVIENNVFLCFILALWGVLTIYESNPRELSGGIMFIIFSKRIANNLIFSILIYIVSGLVIMANGIFNDVSPSQILNVGIVYSSMYLIDYLLYNKREKAQL